MKTITPILKLVLEKWRKNGANCNETWVHSNHRLERILEHALEGELRLCSAVAQYEPCSEVLNPKPPNHGHSF